MQSHCQLITRVHPHTGAVFLAWVLMSVEELPLAFPVRRADGSKPFSRNVMLAALLDSRLTVSSNILCVPPLPVRSLLILQVPLETHGVFSLSLAPRTSAGGVSAWGCEPTWSSLSFRDVLDLPLRFGKFPATIFPHPLPVCCPQHPCHALGSNGDHS